MHFGEMQSCTSSHFASRKVRERQKKIVAEERLIETKSAIEWKGMGWRREDAFVKIFQVWDPTHVWWYVGGGFDEATVAAAVAAAVAVAEVAVVKAVRVVEEGVFGTLYQHSASSVWKDWREKKKGNGE